MHPQAHPHTAAQLRGCQKRVLPQSQQTWLCCPCPPLFLPGSTTACELQAANSMPSTAACSPAAACSQPSPTTWCKGRVLCMRSKCTDTNQPMQARGTVCAVTAPCGAAQHAPSIELALTQTHESRQPSPGSMHVLSTALNCLHRSITHRGVQYSTLLLRTSQRCARGRHTID